MVSQQPIWKNWMMSFLYFFSIQIIYNCFYICITEIAMNYNSIYSAMEADFPTKKDREFGSFVSSTYWKELQFERWFKLKEAYSPALVRRLLSQRHVKLGDKIIDPFLGSGTTLIEARNFGISGYGIEINPFNFFLSKVKLRHYKISDLKNINDGIKKTFDYIRKENKNLKILPETINKPDLSIIDKVFGDKLNIILNIIDFINKFGDDVVQNFLKIGIGCILERCSYVKKDGAGLKYPEGKKPKSIIKSLQKQYSFMLEDLLDSYRKIKYRRMNPRYVLINGDSREERIYDAIDDKCKFSIFSPPYANCFDYTEIYKVELRVLGFITAEDMKTLRESSISSHVNKNCSFKPDLPELEDILEGIDWKETWGGEKTKKMIYNYFYDMGNVFKNLSNVISSKGVSFCVVGNSCYNFTPIATDLFLSRLLEQNDFIVEEIKIARKLLTSSQQARKMSDDKYLRESIIIAQKR